MPSEFVIVFIEYENFLELLQSLHKENFLLLVGLFKEEDISKFLTDEIVRAFLNSVLS